MKPARMDWLPAALLLGAMCYGGLAGVLVVGWLIRLVWGPR